MESLSDRIKSFCLAQGFDKAYWVAFSGGLDSHVLLHICAHLRQQYPVQLNAVHINHGLSSNADQWAIHCANICHELKIHFIQKTISAKAAVGQSPEEVARDRRYDVFADLLASSDLLLTAHQQDDQAETVLLQLLRGTGPKGLAAMPVIKSLGQGFHARPLLDATRADLIEYATQYQLRWIEDESNLNLGFTRNFLRHEILPVLKKRWPSVTKTLSRVAKNCAEVQELCETIALQDLQKVMRPSSHTISISKLLQLPIPRQRQVLRAWLNQLKLSIPSLAKMQQIQDHFLNAGNDKSPHIQWGQVELRRYQDDLYVMTRLIEHNVTSVYEWSLLEPLNLPNVGVLHATLTAGTGLRTDIKQLNVRFRQGGEVCQLPGRHCHHELKKLFQRWKVPPWERVRIPLLYLNDKLVGVVGYFIDDSLLASAGSHGYVISLKMNSI